MRLRNLFVILVAILILTNLANYYRGEMYQLSRLSSQELLALFPDQKPNINLAVVKPIPKWWHFVPILHGNIASSLAPLSLFVFVPIEIHEDMQSKSPQPENMAVLVHEFTHYKNLKNTSIIKASQYLTSRRYRIHEEMRAISTEMHYRANQGLNYDTQRKARHFAGSAYLWAGSRAISEQVLDKLWLEIRTSSF